MRDKKIPSYILKAMEVPTSRKWKSQKRQELRTAIKALEEFQCGCYFVPEYEEEAKAMKALRAIQEAMSVKNWGN